MGHGRVAAGWCAGGWGDDGHDVAAIAADEAAAEGVEAVAVLGGAGFGADGEVFGIEGEVAAAEVERGGVGDFDGAAVGGGGAVEAVVERPAEAVEEGLDVEALLAEASETRLSRYRLSRPRRCL